MLWNFAVRSPEHGLLLLDAKGDITWCNPGAEIILGAERGGLLGRNLAALFPATDLQRGLPEHELHEALARGSALDDRWLQRLDGSHFWAAGVTVHLGEDGHSGIYIKVFRDLTDVKMQMEASREGYLAATQASEGKSMAIAVLAHELRNPLAGVSLAAGLLQIRHPEDGGAKSPLSVIESNVELAARLIADLLEHSRIASPSFALKRSHCELHELLAESVRIAGKQMQQEDRVEPLIMPPAPVAVHVDCQRMQQVFVNLVANAIRYTEPPGRIWISATQEGPEVVVRITDEGEGIAPDKLNSLFEVFTLPNSHGSKLGLGLGLMQVKKIVDAHGGAVQVKSEGPGQGSQFTVRFPARNEPGPMGI